MSSLIIRAFPRTARRFRGYEGLSELDAWLQSPDSPSAGYTSPAFTTFHAELERGDRMQHSEALLKAAGFKGNQGARAMVARQVLGGVALGVVLEGACTESR